MTLAQEKYYELTYYTLAHPDPSFIHQHVVDAFTAQNAAGNSKPIAVAFALIGLHLHIEKKYSGKEVQRAHMQLAKKHKTWPRFTLPKQRGSITVFDVVNTLPGTQRDEAIEKWCASVWNAYAENHDQVANLVKTEMKID